METVEEENLGQEESRSKGWSAENTRALPERLTWPRLWGRYEGARLRTPAQPSPRICSPPHAGEDPGGGDGAPPGAPGQGWPCSLPTSTGGQMRPPTSPTPRPRAGPPAAAAPWLPGGTKAWSTGQTRSAWCSRKITGRSRLETGVAVVFKPGSEPRGHGSSRPPR